MCRQHSKLFWVNLVYDIDPLPIKPPSPLNVNLMVKKVKLEVAEFHGERVQRTPRNHHEDDQASKTEVVSEKSDMIVVKHIDFLGEKILGTIAMSKYLIFSMLLSKMLLMGLKFDMFKFYGESSLLR